MNYIKGMRSIDNLNILDIYGFVSYKIDWHVWDNTAMKVINSGLNDKPRMFFCWDYFE